MFAYGPADVAVTHFLASVKTKIGFTFLVPAHPGSPGQRAIKWMCVHVCVNIRQMHKTMTSDKSSQLCDIIIFDCISLYRTTYDNVSFDTTKKASPNFSKSISWKI